MLSFCSEFKKKPFIHLIPSLPEDMKSKYGVTVADFNTTSDGSTLKLEGREIEKAHDEISTNLHNLIEREVQMTEEFQIEQFERTKAQFQSPTIFLMCSNFLPQVSVTLYSFNQVLLETVAPGVKHLLSLNVVPFKCSPEEAVFLKSFNNAFLKNLPAEVDISEDDQVALSGSDSDVQLSTAKMREVLKDLCSRKFSLSCSEKFESQIEQFLSSNVSEEPSFKYFVQKAAGGRKKGRRNEGLIVFTFCMNAQFFETFCQSFQRFRPCSKFFHLPHHQEL